MPKQTIKGKLAVEILQQYPDAPHRQLARMLLYNNPSVFMSFDEARDVLRYHAGSHGEKNRRTLSDKSNIRPKENGAMKESNPFGLPKSHNDNWKPMRFPVKKGRGMLLFDAHIPYHDVRAVTMALQWGKENGYTDYLFLGGDMIDCYMLSKFEKDPRKRHFRNELDDFSKFLDVLQKEYPNAIIIWKHGNHEDRLERYLKAKAPELFHLKDFIWDEYLGLSKRGVILVEADVPLFVGKLNLIHGHELKGASSQVNPARGAYLKAVECILEGHYHRTSMHAQNSFSRRLDTAWSVGCLCCLWPEYARINNWNYGFAGMEVNGNDFEIENMRIIEANSKWLIR